jgi:hypothetical protein
MREGTSPSTAQIAVVQWTHSLAMMPMILTARRQIRKSANAEHHLVLTSCGSGKEQPGLSTRCAELLEQAKPLVENVTCHSSFELASMVPAFSSVKTVFKGNARGAPADFAKHSKDKGKHPLDIGEGSWCWNGCDGPYLLWYHTIGRGLRHVQFFWFLEWDVIFTGNIVSILSSWSDINEPFDVHADVVNPTGLELRQSRSNVSIESAPALPSHDHDLLCPNPGWANLKWSAHRAKRDDSVVPSNRVYRCTTNIYRMTPRLLDAVLEFSENKRAAMFCEMRSPSICAMNSWCTMRTFFDTWHTHYFHTGHANIRNTTQHATAGADNSERKRAQLSWLRSYLSSTEVNDSQIMPHKNMLYHAYKWQANSTFGKHLISSLQASHSRSRFAHTA